MGVVVRAVPMFAAPRAHFVTGRYLTRDGRLVMQ